MKIQPSYFYLIAILYIFAFFELIGCLNNQKTQSQYEQKLLDKLLRNYNNKLRPSGQSGTVQVQMALNLMQIIDIIEKDQIMVINAFVDHKWTDSRLSWSKLKIFFNLNRIFLYFNIKNRSKRLWEFNFNKNKWCINLDVRKISNNFYIHNTNFIRFLKSKLRIHVKINKPIPGYLISERKDRVVGSKLLAVIISILIDLAYVNGYLTKTQRIMLIFSESLIKDFYYLNLKASIS